MKNNKINKGVIVVILLIIIVVIAVMFLMSKGSYSTTDVEQLSDATNSIIVNCNDVTPGPNETVTCTVKGVEITSQVSSFRANLLLGDGLSLVDISFNTDDWQGSVDNGDIDLYTDSNKTGDFDIVTFTFETTEENIGIDSNIKLQDIYTSDENFDEYEWDELYLDIRVASNINSLSSLTVLGVDFEFDPTITEYELALDLSTTTIEASVENQYSSISGDLGEQNLDFGENTFTIVVTSESGETKEYVLVITRAANLSFSEDIVLDESTGYLKMYAKDITVDEMLSKINTTGNIVIKNTNDEVISGTTKVTTGSKIEISLVENYEYVLVIMGDANKDGSVTVNDVAMLFQKYRGTLETEFSELSFVAGDVKTDSEIKLTDVAKLFQYVRGTIENLK